MFACFYIGFKIALKMDRLPIEIIEEIGKLLMLADKIPLYKTNYGDNFRNLIRLNRRGALLVDGEALLKEITVDQARTLLTRVTPGYK